MRTITGRRARATGTGPRIRPLGSESRIGDGEIAAADAARLARVVGDHPRDRVHAVGVLRRVDGEEAYRPAAVSRVEVAGEQRLDVGPALVVSGAPDEVAVDVDADGRAVDGDLVG